MKMLLLKVRADRGNYACSCYLRFMRSPVVCFSIFLGGGQKVTVLGAPTTIDIEKGMVTSIHGGDPPDER